jgi:hypothetical protein
MEHPHHSSDSAPNDFWLFSEIKYALKGRGLRDIEDIRIYLKTALKAIPLQEFQKCFQQ